MLLPSQETPPSDSPTLALPRRVDPAVLPRYGFETVHNLTFSPRGGRQAEQTGLTIHESDTFLRIPHIERPGPIARNNRYSDPLASLTQHGIKDAQFFYVVPFWLTTHSAYTVPSRQCASATSSETKQALRELRSPPHSPPLSQSSTPSCSAESTHTHTHTHTSFSSMSLASLARSSCSLSHSSSFLARLLAARAAGCLNMFRLESGLNVHARSDQGVVRWERSGQWRRVWCDQETR